MKWLRKWFDMVTGGEAPADVDAEAHRSALWTAFITCCVFYVTAFVLGITLDVLAITVLAPVLGDYTSPFSHFLSFLSLMLRISPPTIFLSFFIPFFIYGFALRCRGWRIPFTILALVSAVFLAYLLSYLITGWKHLNFSDMALFLLVLVTLRLVSAERKKLVSVSASILIVAIAIEFAVTRILVYNSFNEGFPDYLLSVPIYLHWIMDLVRLPVLILLPIGLMASPPPFAFQDHIIVRKQLGWLGRSAALAAIVLGAIYGVLKAIANSMLYNVNMPDYLHFLEPADWSILAVLFVLAVTALFIRSTSKELVAFLFLVPLTILTSRYLLMLGWLPDNGELSASLLIAGLVALTLADERRWGTAKLRASGIIAAGCVLLWLWCWLVLPNLSSEFEGIFVFEANYPIFAAAIARFVLLAFVPAVLFAAWWFISPKEIESLVLGKPELVPQQRNSDGNATNVPGA
jgi:hypothetical protein